MTLKEKQRIFSTSHDIFLLLWCESPKHSGSAINNCSCSGSGPLCHILELWLGRPSPLYLDCLPAPQGGDIISGRVRHASKLRFPLHVSSVTPTDVCFHCQTATTMCSAKKVKEFDFFECAGTIFSTTTVFPSVSFD